MGSISFERRRLLVVWKLFLIFGSLYFIQGIVDPTEGLIAQPVRKLLKGWGHDPEDLAAFSAALIVFWSVKPIFGLLTDFGPLAGYRRRSYLVLASVAGSASFFVLFWYPPQTGAWKPLLSLLIGPMVAVTFADVVTDALMVESAQPLGLTGRLQSVMWGCNYAATILVGVVGGWLSETDAVHLGFFWCGLAWLGPLVLALFIVRERPSPPPVHDLREAAGHLWKNVRSPLVLGVGSFLFLLNFNPFSATVLYSHLTETLELSEQFTGATTAIDAVASIAACIAYGLYCRRVSMSWLLHLSIICTVISTLFYWFMVDEPSAVIVTVAVGFTYMLASLVQYDLAALVCPVENAGTVFALLMALSNLSIALSTWLGGWWFRLAIDSWGRQTAFNVLVGVGAAFTFTCWLLVPYLRRNLIVPADAARGRGP